MKPADHVATHKMYAYYLTHTHIYTLMKASYMQPADHVATHKMYAYYFTRTHMYTDETLIHAACGPRRGSGPPGYASRSEHRESYRSTVSLVMQCSACHGVRMISRGVMLSLS